MDIQKFAIKFFMDKGQQVEPETWFRTFNSWIPDETNEVLVDVADYSHVHEGPVTLLVGHEANYCIDNGKGRLGLLYTRKQPLEGTLSERMESAFKAVCSTCSRLENDLDGQVEFNGSEAQLVLNDRLLVPNTSEAFEAIQGELDGVLKKLYAGTNFTTERVSEEGERLIVNIKADGSWSVRRLLENL